METQGNKAAKHLKPGDTCWIIENNLYAVCGTIKSVSGNFYTIILKKQLSGQAEGSQGIWNAGRS